MLSNYITGKYLNSTNIKNNIESFKPSGDEGHMIFQ